MISIKQVYPTNTQKYYRYISHTLLKMSVEITEEKCSGNFPDLNVKVCDLYNFH